MGVMAYWLARDDSEGSKYERWDLKPEKDSKGRYCRLGNRGPVWSMVPGLFEVVFFAGSRHHPRFRLKPGEIRKVKSITITELEEK